MHPDAASVLLSFDSAMVQVAITQTKVLSTR